jgi:hypothetical protein
MNINIHTLWKREWVTKHVLTYCKYLSCNSITSHTNVCKRNKIEIKCVSLSYGTFCKGNHTTTGEIKHIMFSDLKM